MKKLLLATLLASAFFSVKCAAWEKPILSADACNVLKNIAWHGRSALIWQDDCGHTHISLVNDGIDLRTLPCGTYTGCTCSGGQIVICKEHCDCIFFNGERVDIHALDCYDRHVVVVPRCS